MPLLSNSRSPADAPAYRRATPPELDHALRVLVGGIDGRTTDEQLLEFLAASQQRGLDVRDTWVAVRHGRVIWSVLPVISPGRTMLLLCPPHAPHRNAEIADDIAMLIDHVCQHEHDRHDVELAQMLIDPAEVSLARLYLHAGFIDLAELIYLHRVVKKMPVSPPPPAGVQFITYSESTHGLFIETIRRSYAESLDCPALNGLRDMDDVLEGHKNSGEFDPSLWFLLLENDVPLGAMLLSRSTSGDGVELVYLGLVPDARGRHLGDLFMQLALVTVVRQNRSRLTLAVDSRNVPAIKLYQRHGLSRLGSRRAFIRDLRKTPQTLHQTSPHE